MRRTLILLTILLMLYGAAAAETQLRWEPRWSYVDHGESARISVMLDDPLPLRTIEVFASYDTTLISDLVGSPGELMTTTPCFLFQDYASDVPGVWHGAVVIIGGTCWAEGPGELLRLDFTAGDDPGIAHMITVNVRLFRPDATEYQDVTLSNAYISVGPATTDVPAVASGRLTLAPNPFNPAVDITLDSPAAGPATLTVLDARGRRVARLWSGELSLGTTTWTWRGRDDAGADQPSGTYFFVLRQAGQAPLTTHGALIR